MRCEAGPALRLAALNLAALCLKFGRTPMSEKGDGRDERATINGGELVQAILAG